MENTSYHLQTLELHVCVCVYFLVLTTQVLQDEVQLSSRLEGVDEINNEGMLHLLQDVPLCLGVGRVLGVAYNHSLATSTSVKTQIQTKVKHCFDQMSFPNRLCVAALRADCLHD